MITTLKKIIYKHGYLLIVAALLYSISFIFSNYWFYASSPVSVKEQLESFLQNGEQNFENFAADSTLLDEVIHKKINLKRALAHQKENTGLFAYTPNDSGSLSIVFWNNNKVLPEQSDLKKSDGKYFSIYSNGEFEFIKRTLFIKGKEVIAVAVIPIYWNYFFKNNYLQSGFPANANIEKRYRIVSSNAQFYIRNGDGKVLFGLKEKKKVTETDTGEWSLTLRILSVIFVLIFINIVAFDAVHTLGWGKSLLLLTIPVFLLRLLSYYYHFPFAFRSYELFDPAIYASNKLHPSLGDLLINVVLLFWIVSFIKFVAINYFKNISDIEGKKGWWITSVLLIFLLILSFTSAGIIRSLIIDSKISFDVTNFSNLTIY